MNLKRVFLSERSQLEKTLYYMISFISHTENGKLVDMGNRSTVARDWKFGEG